MSRGPGFLPLALVLLAGLVLTGCVVGDDPEVDPSGAQAEPSLDHPYPDGDEGWPANLSGPFELGRTLTDPIPSHDGTPLETTIYVPDLPEGVGAPVVLWSQPYTGDCAANAVLALQDCMPASDSDYIYEGGYRVDPEKLVGHGYAVAVVNVRGTGNSGGCFGFGGPAEQQDQVHLVEDLAQRDWSNGHVAMYGHSYHGWTPWQAAVHDPEPLKTIVASGVVTDPYTFTYSPQGSAGAIFGGFDAAFSGSLNFLPPLGGGPEHATVEHAPRYPDRLCPEVADVVGEPPKGQFTDVRNGDFWDERRLITGFPDVTTAVLVNHGFEDDSGQGGHAFQEDDIWLSLGDGDPKRMILGRWGHALPPPPERLEDAPFGSDWHEDVLFPWLDHWLKGQGDAGDLHLDTIHFQDSQGGWEETTAWPPASADEEVLYLRPDGDLGPTPAEGQRSFRSAGVGSPACETPGPGGTGLLYTTEPLDAPVEIAGNPWAHLQVESDQPGGLVTVTLLDVEPDFTCSEGLSDQAEVLPSGSADLRFHEGNYQGQDFPLLEPTPVRVDVYNEAWVFEEGHRVGVLVSPGPPEAPRLDQPYSPRITIHGGAGPEASHLVLPLVDGTLGGDPPTLDYPPQPFLPGGAD